MSPIGLAARRRVCWLLLGVSVLAGAVALAVGSAAGRAAVSGRVGTIAFIRMSTNGRVFGGRLFVIRPDGSGLRALTPRSTLVQAYAWSPNGRVIAYVDRRSSLWLVHPDGTGRALLLRGSRFRTMSMSWSPDGKTIAIVTPGWYPGAKPHDPCSHTTIYLVAIGRARPKALPVRAVLCWVAWSPRGDEIAYRDYRDYRGISVIHPNGSARRDVPDGLVGAQWSADGRLLVFGKWGSYGAGSNPYYGSVVVVDSDGTDYHVVTTHAYVGYSAAWSPRGRRLLYGRAHRKGIYVIDADGRNDRRVTRDSPPEAAWGALAWSPNGGSIVYTAGPATNTDLYVIGTDGRGKVQLTHTPDTDIDPTWSAG